MSKVKIRRRVGTLVHGYWASRYWETHVAADPFLSRDLVFAILSVTHHATARDEFTVKCITGLTWSKTYSCNSVKSPSQKRPLFSELGNRVMRHILDHNVRKTSTNPQTLRYHRSPPAFAQIYDERQETYKTSCQVTFLLRSIVITPSGSNPLSTMFSPPKLRRSSGEHS